MDLKALKRGESSGLGKVEKSKPVFITYELLGTCSLHVNTLIKTKNTTRL